MESKTKQKDRAITISETKDATPTKLGTHTIYFINLYLHEILSLKENRKRNGNIFIYSIIYNYFQTNEATPTKPHLVKL